MKLYLHFLQAIPSPKGQPTAPHGDPRCPSKKAPLALSVSSSSGASRVGVSRVNARGRRALLHTLPGGRTAEERRTDKASYTEITILLSGSLTAIRLATLGIVDLTTLVFILRVVL